MCVTTQHYSSIFFFTTFCKKKHFRVYWTKVRWYYLGSSLTSLLDPDGQLRGHIGKWYEITVSRLWLSHSLSMMALSSTYEWSWRAGDTVRVPLRQRFSVTFSVQTCSEITACLSVSADHVSLGSWRQCWPDSHLLCHRNYQLLFHSLQSLNETPVKEQHKHRDKSWACDELQYGLYSQWGWSLVRSLWMTAQKPKALG